MSYPQNYDVRHAGAERALKEIGRDPKERMPPGFGFALFIFEYGEDGSMFYVSSADRTDMLKVLKEFIEREERLAKEGR